MDNRLNIAMVTSSFLPRAGGMEIAMHSIAQAMTADGHRVTVFAPRIKGDNSIGISHGYNVVRYGSSIRGGAKTCYYHLSLLRKLISMNVTQSIDVIHCHSIDHPGCYVRFANKFLRLPVVATPWGKDIQKLPDIGYGIRLKRGWEKKIIKNLESFTIVTSISQSVDEDLKELVPPVYFKKRVISIPAGVWLDKFSSSVNSIETRERYNIPADSKLIISVGRNHVKKGFKYAVEALPSIVQKTDDVYYVIVGRDTEPLRELASHLGVGDKLILTGQISDRQELVKLYKSSDIYLSPSLIETFGITTVEALASGLPLIVTNVPGSRDLHDDSHSFLIEPRSSEAIAEACIKLLQDDDLRKKMGDAALINVQKYDWTMIAKQYIDSYLKAIRCQRIS